VHRCDPFYRGLVLTMLACVRHDSVTEIRLERPPVNALNPALVRALNEAHRDAAERGARAVVLSGRPGIFSAGLDVKELLTLDRSAIALFWKDFFGLLRTIATSTIPTAVALTGHSPAGGAVIALFADYRVATRGPYKIGFNEVAVGLPLPEVIHQGVARVVGRRQAERLGVSALMIDPEEARRIGLVDELCEPDRTVSAAIDWCERVLALPPHAMSLTRWQLRREMAGWFDALDEATVTGLADVWFSEETQGAMHALVDRLNVSGNGG
jgi:enoyl-CoA hydratase/carnithine racemase